MAAVGAAEPGGGVVVEGGVGGGEVEPFWGVDVLVELVPDEPGLGVFPVDVGGLHWLRIFCLLEEETEEFHRRKETLEEASFKRAFRFRPLEVSVGPTAGRELSSRACTRGPWICAYPE